MDGFFRSTDHSITILSRNTGVSPVFIIIIIFFCGHGRLLSQQYMYMYICFEEDSSTYLLFVSMNEPNYLVNLIASRPGQNRHRKINPNHYTSPAPFAFTKLQLGST